MKLVCRELETSRSGYYQWLNHEPKQREQRNCAPKRRLVELHPTGEGWLYLAIVKDLCSRKIVGYAFSDRIDAQLTLSALEMAYRRRKPERGVIFHSGRGVQYAARAYRERLEAYGIRQSMSCRVILMTTR